MIFDAKIDSKRFNYIEWYCQSCKAKGVSMDTKKTKCSFCNESISHLWDHQKFWSEKH